MDNDIRILIGETIIKIVDLTEGSGSAHLYTESGKLFKMYHDQDCCESVYIEDIDNDIDILLNSPILDAYESTSDNFNPKGFKPESHESCMWTFYRIRSKKGGLTVRWFGESNGCYSESVSFVEIKK